MFLFIAAVLGMGLAWLICFLLTEYKYLWCKRNCKKCGNWQCKFFQFECLVKRLDKDGHVLSVTFNDSNSDIKSDIDSSKIN